MDIMRTPLQEFVIGKFIFILNYKADCKICSSTSENVCDECNAGFQVYSNACTGTCPTR